ncbi:DNA polymerase III subunit beta [Blochmannia endosymbiont of Polyrhachis (Hedomyrma) turneri]|uniref:DNA polymerase III subunit beta n=1 Tax=Blochmannia endosymbiont of Polyrhachis (Hedomyrma) turneri TaxID=1505596 RepID=UPI00061A7045|nr:DNA polymerase III subunit beta [Blochmannia endosymbiont of Polyrhachis (Hedomyrma) turneri]AKC59613.1 DNA polymerase III subunit beta [Blochmannia endosymbiont of Polyrhachis (Hedomyrma) turneri]
MYIIIERNFVFHALQNVLGFVGGVKSSSPILGHILLEVRNNNLFMIGTNIDIEIVVYIPIYKIYDIGQITVPAKKFFDICRALSVTSKIILRYQESKLFISSEGSSFSLVTFSPLDFPNMGVWDAEIEFTVSSNVLRNVIELTQFSMGKRDVRYYLNGMLFEFNMKNLCAVATDGHRLAYCSVLIVSTEVDINSSFSIIVPRKYVISMTRMLDVNEEKIKLKIGRQNISIVVGNYVVTSKLINGIFPNYKSVFPKESKFVLEVAVKKLQQAIKRAMILCSEKFHVVRFLLGLNQLKIVSSNPEHELSEQLLDVVYSGRDMEIGFNIYYIIDILNVIRSNTVRFLLTDEHSSVKIVSYPMDISVYIIMPIRL